MTHRSSRGLMGDNGESGVHDNDLEAYQRGRFGVIPMQTFFSSPLKAPIWQINKLDLDKIDDTRFIFTTGWYGGAGPSIISSASHCESGSSIVSLS